MPRFAVDYLDVLLPLLRAELGDEVTVMSRIPDSVESFLPLVVVRRTGGDSTHPEFFDTPLVRVECWCRANEATGVDQYREASDLADQVRGVFWRAWRTQQVVPSCGWIGSIRESQGPLEIGDVDLPQLGRVTATYEMRIRPAV